MKSDTLSINLGKGMKNKLSQYAKAKEVPMAFVIRVAVDRLLRDSKR